MSFDNFPPHFRLLLLAVRVPLTSADAERLRRIAANDIDWRAFLAAAHSHRLSPLALCGLQSAALSAVPDFVFRELQSSQQASAMRAVKITLETQRIVNHFAASGFTLICLKGITLSQTIYGDPYLRHSGDLDLLTEERDLPGQLLRMRELGYELVDPACAASPRRLRLYIRYQKDLSLCHVQSGRMVDLHWRLFNNRLHKANRLGMTAPINPGQSINASFRTLSRLDQFVYCAAHGSADAWVYFKGLADIAALLHVLSPEELTQALIRTATLGLLPQVSSAIHLAAEFMGARVQHPLLLSPGDSFHQAMRSKVIRNLERSAFTPRRHNPGLFAAMRIELQLTPGLRSMREVIRRYLWRPRIWSIVNLPDALLWLTPLLGLVIPPRVARAPSGPSPPAHDA
ncbi:nucleotidyltransferase domain-containing protein [Granulicella tundricola]|uniref:Nucleotidyltransferase family protein n=1 Tax=Granulicella tundricola (strain ATCC BAA-1859 / DSM 23138 / MP5ACTX9) TaxID=1198114 RepID=E8X100_GRATM|nr:nucleotidyltransferase family protein [Granulicella tundricola]ADW67866.1 hypothetical protein AciX9_0798 [Granulicella tundricola MP5ACTX9]